MSIRVPAISLATAATNAGVSIPLCFDEVSRGSIHAEYGAITGTFTVEASNDPKAFPGHYDYANAKWDDITAIMAFTDPVGGADDWTQDYDNINYDYIRISYTHTAGAGSLYVWFSGRAL